MLIRNVNCSPPCLSKDAVVDEHVLVCVAVVFAKLSNLTWNREYPDFLEISRLF